MLRRADVERMLRVFNDAGYQGGGAVSPLAREDPQQRPLSGRDVRVGQRRGAGGRLLVRVRGGGRGAREERLAGPARGADLVEGIRAGARAVRRRRRAASVARVRTDAELGAAARPLPRSMAGALQPPGALSVRLPGSSRRHPAPRPRRVERAAAPPARRRERSTSAMAPCSPGSNTSSICIPSATRTPAWSRTAGCRRTKPPSGPRRSVRNSSNIDRSG